MVFVDRGKIGSDECGVCGKRIRENELRLIIEYKGHINDCDGDTIKLDMLLTVCKDCATDIAMEWLKCAIKEGI